jgi:hypothetical protein
MWPAAPSTIPHLPPFHEGVYQGYQIFVGKFDANNAASSFVTQIAQLMGFDKESLNRVHIKKEEPPVRMVQEPLTRDNIAMDVEGDV